jgi:hypothetical protein
LLNENKRSLAFEKDAKVVEAYHFQKAIAACTNDYDYEDLFHSSPDKFTAASFWIEPVKFTTPVISDRPTVMEVRQQAALEAYMLTGATQEVVANKMGISRLAVSIYESWFYDFRPHYATAPWMSTFGMRGDVSGCSGCTFEHLLRQVGWKCGIEAVDDLLSGIQYGEATIEMLRTNNFHHLVKGAAVAARNVYHQATLFEAANRMIEAVDKRREIEVMAGNDYKSEDEKAHILQSEADLKSKAWCMVEAPKDAEESVPAVEKRISVQLGYEPDLSIREP